MQAYGDLTLVFERVTRQRSCETDSSGLEGEPRGVVDEDLEPAED